MTPKPKIVASKPKAGAPAKQASKAKKPTKVRTPMTVGSSGGSAS